MRSTSKSTRPSQSHRQEERLLSLCDCSEKGRDFVMWHDSECAYLAARERMERKLALEMRQWKIVNYLLDLLRR